MPAKRLSMRKIREVLRLKWAAGMSNRRIAASCGVSRPTVSEYLRRAESAGLSWRLPADASDARLERLLFPPPDVPASARGVPDFAEVHRQLKRKGVTLFLLWQEYRAACPDGYQYSWCFNRIRVSHLCIDTPLPSCCLGQQDGPPHRARQTGMCAVLACHIWEFYGCPLHSALNIAADES